MPDTSKKNTNSSSNSNSGKSGNSGARPSQYAFIKESWGSRKEFQLSYGLKMTSEDLKEGNRILEDFEKQGAFEKKM